MFEITTVSRKMLGLNHNVNILSLHFASGTKSMESFELTLTKNSNFFWLIKILFVR